MCMIGLNMSIIGRQNILKGIVYSILMTLLVRTRHAIMAFLTISDYINNYGDHLPQCGGTGYSL